MTTNQILKKALKNSGLTQKQLAGKIGAKNQSNIAMMLKSNNSGVERFRNVLEILGYQIEITNGKDRWVLDGIEERDTEKDRKEIMKKLKGLSGREFSAIEDTLAELLKK